jgi:uncharacterized protein (DUF1499 family)
MTFYLLMIGVVVVLGLVLWARSVPRAHDLGVRPSGELAPCPDKPNCVASTASKPEQFLAPWPYTGSSEEARARLLLILRLLPNAQVIADEELYLAAEFRVAQLFMDDVEFRIDPQQQVVHFRSASRLGKSDFGVNRKRLQRIGDAFRASLTVEVPAAPPEADEPTQDPDNKSSL